MDVSIDSGTGKLASTASIEASTFSTSGLSGTSAVVVSDVSGETLIEATLEIACSEVLGSDASGTALFNFGGNLATLRIGCLLDTAGVVVEVLVLGAATGLVLLVAVVEAVEAMEAVEAATGLILVSATVGANETDLTLAVPLTGWTFTLVFLIAGVGIGAVTLLPVDVAAAVVIPVEVLVEGVTVVPVEVGLETPTYLWRTEGVSLVFLKIK